MADADIGRAIEVAKDRLYYVTLRAAPHDRADAHFFTVDDSLHYWPFFLDFGPLSLGNLYRFSQLLNAKLLDKSLSSKRIYLWSGPQMNKRANAVYLLAAYTLLYHGRTPEEAWRPFAAISPPLAPWHDASPTVDTFHLSVLDVLRGIAKARECRFFSFDAFDVDEYEHYERVENGDMNWLAQGRFLAFAGPHDVRTTTPEGYHTTAVDDVVPYFRARGISAVIRLNKRYYNERRFMAAGIDHHDMYYLDGSNPPEPILQRFLATCEQTPGAIAVHCKAGLGRTGTCIGAYCMKHYRFTAREIIGWMRVCRPGSVIGPQQHFMEDIQARMWEEGEAFRRIRRLPMPVPTSLLGQWQAAQAAAAAGGGGGVAGGAGIAGPATPGASSSSPRVAGSSYPSGSGYPSGAGAMPGSGSGAGTGSAGGGGGSGFSSPVAGAAARAGVGAGVGGGRAAGAGGSPVSTGVGSSSSPVARPGMAIRAPVGGSTSVSAAADMFSHLTIATDGRGGSGSGSGLYSTGQGTPGGGAASAAAASAAAAVAAAARASVSRGGSRATSGSPTLRGRTTSGASDYGAPLPSMGLGGSASAAAGGKSSVGSGAWSIGAAVGRTPSGKTSSAGSGTTLTADDGSGSGGGTPTVSRAVSLSSFASGSAAAGGGSGLYASPGSSPIATGVLSRARSRGASAYGTGGTGGSGIYDDSYVSAGGSGGAGRGGSGSGLYAGAGVAVSPVAVPAVKPSGSGGYGAYSGGYGSPPGGGLSASAAAAAVAAAAAAGNPSAAFRTPTGEYSQGDALRSAKSRSPTLSALSPAAMAAATGGSGYGASAPSPLSPLGASSGLRYAGTGVVAAGAAGSATRSPGFAGSSGPGGGLYAGSGVSAGASPVRSVIRNR